MLRFEDSLPKLPVPELAETTARYLRSVKPLLSESEYATTSKAVEHFTTSGEGAKLQERLLARRDETKNWLYEWWNEAAYLSVRDSVFFSSYLYSHRSPRCDPVKRAAAICTAALEFKKSVDNATLEPEYMRDRPSAMESHQWMFNACRIPASPVDHVAKYPHAENNYILVLRKNHLFKVMQEFDGHQLSTSELEQQIKRVYSIADSSLPTIAVGALTTEDRDTWAAARQKILDAHPSNAEALKDVEAASFVVCLDDAAPVTLEERAHAYMHAYGRNRWFDKPAQFIVNDNGTSGFNGEHSMMDGTATHRLNDFVCHAIHHKKFDSSSSPRSFLPEPTIIKFHINKDIRTAVEQAERTFRDVVDAHELRVQAYQGYGKNLIKKLGCSPDAYVQILIQLAYYKMYGRNRPTYESVMTRRFQQGRTEACRTVSSHSVAFCKAMVDERELHDAGELATMFKKALKSHVEYVSAASAGHGVDRHLFGLKKLVRPGEQLPSIFKDPAYSYSGRWVISTSQLSSEYLNGFGWTQVVEGGWGIAYMINANSLSFNIMSKGLGSDRMSFYINESAEEVRDMLVAAAGSETAKPKL